MIISFHFHSCPFITIHVLSFPLMSFPFIPFHFVSFHSFHFLSFPFINSCSFHFDSFPCISSRFLLAPLVLRCSYGLIPRTFEPETLCSDLNFIDFPVTLSNRTLSPSWWEAHLEHLDLLRFHFLPFFTSFHFHSCPFISVPFMSIHFFSFPVISFHSFPFASFHFFSFPVFSFPLTHVLPFSFHVLFSSCIHFPSCPCISFLYPLL